MAKTGSVTGRGQQEAVYLKFGLANSKALLNLHSDASFSL